jgi:hypothetical protein
VRDWKWHQVLREVKRFANHDEGADWDIHDHTEAVPRDLVVEKFSKVADKDGVEPEETLDLAVDTGKLERRDGGLVPAETPGDDGVEGSSGGSNPTQEPIETEQEADCGSGAPMPAPDDIPEEVREDDKWVLYDTDRGKQPHWAGNFGNGEDGFTWSDPEWWHSFEDAIMMAETRNSWGVGRVNTADNDDAPESDTVGWDLDGCLEDTDGSADPKEWLPDITPLLDEGVYFEFSPSGTGLRAFGSASVLPDWWNTDLSMGDHEGVEILTNKYSTATGNKVTGAGDKPITEDYVDPAVVEEFLLRAYINIEGEYPPGYTGEELDDVVLEDAGTEDYETKEVNRGETAPEDIPKCVRKILEAREGDNAGYTAHTLNLHAAILVIYAGYEVETDEEGEVDGEALFRKYPPNGTTAEYDKGHTVKELRRTKEKIEDDELAPVSVKTLRENGVFGARESCGDSCPIHGNDAQRDTTGISGGDGTVPDAVDLVEKDGCLGRWEQSENGGAWFERVANFTVETEARVDHIENDTRHLKLKINPENEDAYKVDVEPKVFNSPDRFENNVVVGYSTRFDGGKEARNDLRELVGLQQSDVLRGTNLMGLHPREDGDGVEFVTPDGTLDGDGWTEDPEVVYVERQTDIERRCRLSPDDEVEGGDVEEVLRLLPKIRDPERFLTVVGWFYAAPLKPMFLEWVGEFPLLSVTGDTGSGKTSTLQVLWQAFGMDDDPLSVDTTPHAQLTNFSSSHSVPVWFDEYRPVDIDERRVSKFHDYCRKTTKGASESKGRPDGSTDTYLIKAPIAVSGEQQFQDPSLVRRSVLTNFKTGVTDEGTETERSFSRLVGKPYEDEDGRLRYPEPKDLEGHATEYYTWLTSKDEEKLKQAWRDCRQDTDGVLGEHGITGLDTSERTALQVTLFGLRLYQEFADDMGVEVPVEAFDVGEDVESSLAEAGMNVGEGENGNRRSHLDEFLEKLAHAAMSGYLEEDEHYTFIRDGDVLRFNLSRSYPKVRKYHREHNLTSDLLERSEYMGRLTDECEKDSSCVERTSQPTDPIGRAVGIYINEVPEHIDMSASMFRDVDPDEGGGGEGPETLKEVEVGDWVAVTAEVWDEEEHGHEAIRQKGTLKDVTDTVGFLVWSDSETVLQPETCYRMDAVKVDEFEGARQIQIGERTKVEEIKKGDGWTESDNDGNEKLIEDPHKATLDVVRDVEGSDRDEVVEEVSGRGVDEGAADRAVEELLRRGVLIENNGLRVA